MFDLGDLSGMGPRDLLKVTQVFVTHTHMDHFIGFDHLLRALLGREKEIHLYGPPGFFNQVQGKLAGYTWNLVDGYRYNLVIKVSEVHPDRVWTRTYLCRDRFRAAHTQEESPFSGILLKEPAFYVEAALLDHRIPCLGLSLVENFTVNINKEALRELGLPVGPWLNRFKRALYENADKETPIRATWEERGQVVKEKVFVLGDLAEKIAMVSPGQKVTYITDIVGSGENCEKVVGLARGADHLFIEAAFLDRDKETAREKYHLTAREAGEVARLAGVKQMTVFHFSPRYSDLGEEIRKEAEEAFRREV